MKDLDKFIAIEELIFNAMDYWMSNAHKYETYDAAQEELEKKSKSVTLKILSIVRRSKQ